MGRHRDWHVPVLSRPHDGNGDVFERLYMDPDLENGTILHLVLCRLLPPRNLSCDSSPNTLLGGEILVDWLLKGRSL